MALMAFATGAALACVLAPLAAQTNGIAVVIDNFVFTPERLTVKPGTTVSWTNHDDIRTPLPPRIGRSSRK
jgi:plastocyanin